MNRELSKQIYVLVVVIITLQFFLLLGVFVSYARAKNTEKTEKTLAQIAVQLEQKLPGDFESIIAGQGGQHASKQKRIEILNHALQPIIKETSAQWPGYGMGYYVRNLNIVAVYPEKMRFLGKPASAECLKVYQTGKLRFSTIPDGFTLGGRRESVAVNYPIYHDNQIVGHVWANVPVWDMNQGLQKEILLPIAGFVILWLLLLFLIKWSISRFVQVLGELIRQISEEKPDPKNLKVVPQLIVVLHTVQGLREKLEQEYEQKKKVQDEMARLDQLNLVGQMAAAVAHEIRNPMTVVMGYIQMMAQKADVKMQSSFQVVIEELKNVNDIIESFLSIARSKELDQAKNDLNILVENLYPLIYAECVGRGITILVECEPALPPVWIDEKEIRQLLLNLVRNGIEVMEAEGTLTIRTRYLQLYNEVIVSITDTGQGIPEEILDHIFDPFYTTKEYGTGLGLAVCRNIAERHHGRIEVVSTLGSGTTFEVIFPATLLSSQNPAQCEV